MACKCDAGAPNTGFPSCLEGEAVLSHFIVVPKYSSAGVLNKIASADVLDQTYLDGKLNAANKADRWYPLAPMKNITQERADSITEEAGDGSLAFIRKGVKTFSGEAWSQSRQYAGKLDDFRCIDKAVFAVYTDGSIVGKCIDASGDLYPYAVENSSWEANYVDATDSTINKVVLSFQVAQSEQEKEFYKIASSEYTFDLLGAKGLLDVSATYSSITTTGFTAQFDTIYGTKNSKIKVEGLVSGDMTLFNDTDALAVTITSVTEVSAGVYAIVIPVQDSGDVLTLTVSKNGFDFSAIAKITIP